MTKPVKELKFKKENWNLDHIREQNFSIDRDRIIWETQKVKNAVLTTLAKYEGLKTVTPPTPPKKWTGVSKSTLLA